MLQSLSQTEAVSVPSLFAAFAPLRVAHVRPAMQAEPLAREAEAEVVEFLSERPAHAVNLLGLIADNGLVSPHNRGTFYACRDERGCLVNERNEPAHAFYRRAGFRLDCHYDTIFLRRD